MTSMQVVAHNMESIRCHDKWQREGRIGGRSTRYLMLVVGQNKGINLPRKIRVQGKQPRLSTDAVGGGSGIGVKRAKSMSQCTSFGILSHPPADDGLFVLCFTACNPQGSF